MTSANRIQQLERVELFSSISSESLVKLATLMKDNCLVDGDGFFILKL